MGTRDRGWYDREMTPPRLRKLGDLPLHLQFNSYILSGYRPPMDARGCAKSLLYLHNESFNIYSHCLTLFYFVLTSWDYWGVWPHRNSVVTLFICIDCVCSILPFALSVLYHTFMCHHSGEKTYRQLLKSDVFGVWLACTFGSISTLYTGLYCLPTLRQLYLLLYMFISSIVLYYLLVVDCKRQRVMALTVQFVFRVLVHFVPLSSLSTGTSGASRYLVTMDAISAMGAVINALHIPERWATGKLDYVCNGHTLMHVAAFLSVAVGRQGFLLNMAWLNHGPTCTPSL